MRKLINIENIISVMESKPDTGNFLDSLRIKDDEVIDEKLEAVMDAMNDALKTPGGVGKTALYVAGMKKAMEIAESENELALLMFLVSEQYSRMREKFERMQHPFAMLEAILNEMPD